MKTAVFVPFLIAAVSALFVGCSNSDILTEPEKETNVEATTKVSIEQALKKATDLMADIESPTRSKERSVESVDVIYSRDTRSGLSNDSLLYLINFANNAGFALMGSDQRMSDVYAISSEGHLTMQDVENHELLQQFMSDAIQDASGSVSTNDVIIPGYTYTYSYLVKTNTGKLLNTNVANWSQLAPFNKYCMANGVQSYPGCLPVAAAMVMSYMRWPEQYSNRQIDWVKMVDENNTDEVARFFKLLGIPFSVGYTEDGGGASTTSIKPGFKTLGYDVVTDYFDKPFVYNSNLISQLLIGIPSKDIPAQPVLIASPDGYIDGHAFVVDGLITRTKLKYRNGKFVGEMSAEPLWHVVWGWNYDDVNYNGYFKFSFTDDKFGDVSYDVNDNPDGESMMTPNGNSFTQLLIFSGFKPVK